MNNLSCPQCGLSHIKRNGYTHYGKQNYRCKDCDRQFVEDSQHIGEEEKDLIKVLLLERLSLRGIRRVTGVSLTWLLDFIAEIYAESPDDFNVKVCQARGVVQLLRLEAEADEMWSFVVSKRNKQWIWIALDGATKQVIAFYVGDRSASSARELWRRIPQVYRDHATFYTDGLAAYKTVLPSERHQVCAKSSGHTNTLARRADSGFSTCLESFDRRAIDRISIERRRRRAYLPDLINKEQKLKLSCDRTGR